MVQVPQKRALLTQAKLRHSPPKALTQAKRRHWNRTQAKLMLAQLLMRQLILLEQTPLRNAPLTQAPQKQTTWVVAKTLLRSAVTKWLLWMWRQGEMKQRVRLRCWQEEVDRWL